MLGGHSHMDLHMHVYYYSPYNWYFSSFGVMENEDQLNQNKGQFNTMYLINNVYK